MSSRSGAEASSLAVDAASKGDARARSSNMLGPPPPASGAGSSTAITAVGTTPGTPSGSGSTPAAASPPPSHPPLTLSITLVRAANLRGSKADKVSSFVKCTWADLEFAPGSGGHDSITVVDSPAPEYKHTFTMDVAPTPALLDTILNVPVIFTLHEVLPKDKSAVLGSAELDLGPMLLSMAPTASNLGGSATVPIEYLAPKMLGADEASMVKPVLELEVSLNRPAVEDYVLETSNVLELTPADMSPVPDEWNVKEQNEKDVNSNIYHYSLNLTLPVSPTVDRVVHVPYGVLAMAATNATDGNPLAASGSGLMIKRISWSRPFRTLLTAPALKKLRERILSKTLLEVDVVRVPQQKYVGVVDPLASRYKGKCNLDLSSLLLPDTTQTTVVAPISNVDVDDKDAGSAAQIKTRVSMYKQLDTRLSVRLGLSRPLVDKRRFSAGLRSIFEYIPRTKLPPHQIYAKRVAMAQDEYKDTIRQLVKELANEYSAVATATTGHHVTGGGTSSGEVSRGDFLRHVQEAGLYHRLRAVLKPAVVRVLREQYKHFFDGPSQRSAMVAGVYVQLVDMLNTAIAQHQSMHATEADQTASARQARDTELLALATTSERDGDISGAVRWHAERIARAPDDLMAQYAAAACCARAGDAPRARTLLQSILGRHSTHVSALVALGALASASVAAAVAGDPSARAISAADRDADRALAETCLLTALKQAKATAGGGAGGAREAAWLVALLAAHYATTGDDDQADGCLAEAEQLATSGDPEIYLAAATECMQVGALGLAERLLAYDLIHRSAGALSAAAKDAAVPVRALLVRADLHLMQGRHDLAEPCLKQAVQRQLDAPEVWAKLGHLYWSAKRIPEARAAYEALLALHPTSQDTTVLVRLAEILYSSSLEDEWDWGSRTRDPEAARGALALFLQAQHWAGVGLASLSLGMSEEAEAALCHATSTAPREARGWAVLALLHMSRGHVDEAEQCASYVLRLGLRHPALLRAVATRMHYMGRIHAAEQYAQAALDADSSDERSRGLLEEVLSRAGSVFADDDGRNDGRNYDGRNLISTGIGI
ncbi:hypothetical protein BC828DRAFT_407885 [Blastocladiella britannica]|nr:hypothetical protein BC828DRAFT_407885 [Blastocladiella britannica]